MWPSARTARALFRLAGRTISELWDAQTGRHAALAMNGHTGTVWAVSFRPDGSQIATAGADGTVKVWDAQTGGELVTLKGHTGSVFGVSFSPDGACRLRRRRPNGDALARADGPGSPLARRP